MSMPGFCDGDAPAARSGSGNELARGAVLTRKQVPAAGDRKRGDTQARMPPSAAPILDRSIHAKAGLSDLMGLTAPLDGEEQSRRPAAGRSDPVRA
jgi:hypothetical protein